MVVDGAGLEGRDAVRADDPDRGVIDVVDAGIAAVVRSGLQPSGSWFADLSPRLGQLVLVQASGHQQPAVVGDDLDAGPPVVEQVLHAGGDVVDLALEAFGDGETEVVPRPVDVRRFGPALRTG